MADIIRRMANYGQSASPAVIYGVASLILRHRLTITIPPLNEAHVLGTNFIAKFKGRQPEVRSCCTRSMEEARIDETQPKLLRAWFDEIEALSARNRYETSNIYDMDENGYSIRSTQSSHVLVVVDEPEKDSQLAKSKSINAIKKSKGRQEWVTAIECVSADGRALPPLMICKGQAQWNNCWLPQDVDIAGWQWYTSFTGWTSNWLCLKWLVKFFQPQTTPQAPNQRRLLILDGHGSHFTSDFIGFCMVHAIDIMILTSSLHPKLNHWMLAYSDL